MKKLIIALLLFAPLFASASIESNLYYGIRNKAEVTELQEFLSDKGFLNHSATGSFYSLTLSAVKNYQTSVGISPTGYVGVLTRASINDALLADLQSSNDEAVAETGSVPVSVTTPSDSEKLQVQLAQAEAQRKFDALQQQATLNQIQQNTQQIAQNTTPIQNITPVAPIIPVPTCTILAESLQPERHDVAVPLKISWVSTNATRAVIEGDFHGSNLVKYQLIQETTNNVNSGYDSAHAGIFGVDVRGTFTGPGGTTLCYYSLPQ